MEDDQRIWQQAVRSSQGRIKVHPCVVDSVDRLNEFEVEVSNIVASVYDEARAYSLRDGDLIGDPIEDIGPLIRLRLNCRSAENLMLTSEALSIVGTDWSALEAKIHTWVQSNPTHQYCEDVTRFRDKGFDRRNHDLKSIRNILVAMTSNKPWEV